MSGNLELTSLLHILTDSVNTLIKSDSVRSLQDCDPSPPSPPTPEAVRACTAARQLIATLEGGGFPLTSTLAVHTPACLRVAIEAHVTEVLKAAPAKYEKGDGLHVNEIVKATGSTIDPSNLARILRYLSAHYIFREVAPDVFANTSTSLTLDTGKSVEELKAAQNFYEGTNGIAALIAHTADDVAKADSYISEALFSPSSTSSGPIKAPFEVATGQNVWEYFGREVNKDKLVRFSVAMTGLTLMEGSGKKSIVSGFPFGDLRENTLVVDVGGGAGGASFDIISAFPHLKMVVQDRPEVIGGEAPKYWQQHLPEAISSGQVKLMTHDFFTKQPLSADVYMLRAIIHDWPTSESIQILSHLAASANKSTKLILVEHVTDYLCPSETLPKLDANIKFHGKEITETPFPLLPRFEGSQPYALDLQMMVAVNAQERTLAQFEELGKEAGWKLTDWYRLSVGWNHLVFELAWKQR